MEKRIKRVPKHPSLIGFYCWCVRCDRLLGLNAPKYADLNGQAFVDYYCRHCVQDIAGEIEIEPPPSLD